MRNLGALSFHNASRILKGSSWDSRYRTGFFLISRKVMSLRPNRDPTPARHKHGDALCRPRRGPPQAQATRSEAARPWRNPVIMLVPCADRNHHRHDGPEKTVLELQFSHSGIVQKDFRMARVFVTGSADGLGKMAGELLIEKGHKAVLHARSAERADETRKKVVRAEDIVVGNLSSIAETRSVAD
jgi:hypothetical protein